MHWKDEGIKQYWDEIRTEGYNEGYAFAERFYLEKIGEYSRFLNRLGIKYDPIKDEEED